MSCAECKEWWFDPKEGKFHERPVGTRLKRPVDKEGNVHLPCVQCPKGSPEKEHEFVLTKDNAELVSLFQKMEARHWQGLPPACLDEVNADMMVLIRQIVDAGKQRQNAEMIASKLAPLLLGGK